ncbi:polysaccharide deacetylase family protein [Verminephrobacter eiseniae]|uniref:Polysaccharide deacetylase n=2 Tax=Verminephrobacter eiseniae TaxID=364317 RepID=A1WEP6_VEREI|nr:polysaccharide deacetylase [Verminephrobacter eiseniae]ABM56103.1 polysaccharide deacetylase [Verminephrobacter eiseniae EF01-2]
MHPNDPVAWPHGARCAVMLAFDFDAETLWLARDPANAKRLGVLSQGTYGAKVGVPRIIETLDEADVPATFFVPGWTAEHHTGRVESILRHGHEVGHHGYLHEWVDPQDPAREEEIFLKGLQALQRTVGVKPLVSRHRSSVGLRWPSKRIAALHRLPIRSVLAARCALRCAPMAARSLRHLIRDATLGYRSPAWEASLNLMALIDKHGLRYDSSLMDQINPYHHVLADGRRGPVELPVHWSLDDAPFALFSVKSPRTIVSNEQILAVWQDEFSEIYRWGGLFSLTMHPQVMGRPSRIALLRAFIAWMRSFPGVWFARGAEIAQAWTDACLSNRGIAP